jgi:hypothetical protein
MTCLFLTIYNYCIFILAHCLHINNIRRGLTKSKNYLIQLIMMFLAGFLVGIIVGYLIIAIIISIRVRR